MGSDTGRRVGQNKLMSLEAAAATVADGARIGFGGGNALWRRPMAFARELVRQERSGLHLVHMIAGLESDLLLGMGMLESTNCCYFGLDEFGQSAHFQRAAKVGSVKINEFSEFTLVASLRAAGMGLPFLPWKTAWGTDIVKHQGWKTIICPYTDMELLAVPANPLDVTVIQVERADLAGNVELGHPLDFIHDFDVLIARAAKRVIVCAEEVAPLRDPNRTAMIGREVDAVVEAPRGAWPCGFIPHYQIDAGHVSSEYVPATSSRQALESYVERFVRPSELELAAAHS